MSRTSYALATIVAMLSVAVPVRSQPMDLAVEEMEISQGILNPSHELPLIANRSTLVRVTIVSSGTDEPVAGVSGRLNAFVNGAAVTPPGGLEPVNDPFTVSPDGGGALSENSTLNFEMIAPTGISTSDDVDFVFEMDHVPGDTDPHNDDFTVSNLEFVSPSPIHIYHVKVRYWPAVQSLFPHELIAQNVGPDFIRATYPINDGAPGLYIDSEIPTINYANSCKGDDMIGKCGGGGPVCSPCEIEGLFLVLETCRQLIVNDGMGAQNNTFLYGWLGGNPIEGNGYASTEDGGKVAFGNTSSPRFHKTFAHEIGHLILGRDHTMALTEKQGWDIGSRIDNPNDLFPSTTRLRPAGLHGLMGTAITSETWILESEYLALFNALPALSDGVVAANSLSISGSFNPEGTQLQLDPVFRYPWPSQGSPVVKRSDARYVLIMTDEKGERTRRYFSAPMSTEDGRPSEYSGSFSLNVPPPRSPLVAIEVKDLSENTIFASVRKSKPPRVAIASVPGKKSEYLKWRIYDEDTDRAAMMSHVVYSVDDGRSFRPLGVRITQDFIRVDEAVRNKGRSVMYRVFVSDGFTTAFADARSAME